MELMLRLLDNDNLSYEDIKSIQVCENSRISVEVTVQGSHARQVEPRRRGRHASGGLVDRRRRMAAYSGSDSAVKAVQRSRLYSRTSRAWRECRPALFVAVTRYRLGRRDRDIDWVAVTA